MNDAETSEPGTDMMPTEYKERKMAPAPLSSRTIDIHTKDMHSSVMTKMTRNLATKAANFFITENHSMRQCA